MYVYRLLSGELINMPVCSFCRRRYNEPRGLTVFTFDGRSIHFCSSKCRKNMDHLKRDPKKTNWVIKRADFRKGAGNPELLESKIENNNQKTEVVPKPQKTTKKQ
jgi:large subunit ribosomal protein L24e